MIYFFVLILTLFFVYQYDILKKKRYYFQAYFLLLALSVSVAGCRYVVGGDSVRYIRYFDYYPVLSDDLNLFSYSFFDPGWLLLNSIVKTICDDFIFFQFVHAIILNGFLFSYIWKNTEHRFTVILFYFMYQYLYFNTEILRESLAVICFLSASQCYINKCWKRYYLWAIVAFLFHSSAILLFLYPVFRYIRFGYCRVLLLLICNILLWTYLADAFSYFFVNPLIAQKFEMYQSQSMNLNGKILRFVEYVAFPLILIFLKRKKLDRNIGKYEPFYMLYFFIASTMVANTVIAGRMINYMAFFMLLFYVDFLYCIQLPKGKLILIIFILLPMIPNWMYYTSDVSYVQNGLKFYHRWYPYTDVFHQSNREQMNVVQERIEDVDAAMQIETKNKQR